MSDSFSAGASRFALTRGRIGNAAGRGINYPSPFFDIAHTYLPTTVKQMFRWCRYYFLVHPLINTTIFRMAQYGVTDIVLQTDDEMQKNRWDEMLHEQLRYRSFMMDGGLDYFCYGNLLVSIFYPFKKMLECPNCKHTQQVRDASYHFRNYGFWITCPKCGHMGEARAYDQYIRSSRGIRLLRWNPEDVDIRYNDLNGEYTYYYEIPLQVKNDIIMGKRHVVEEVPQIFIEALKRRRAIVFSKDNIFHMKRPSLAGKDRGWGTPLPMPVLKDTFYLQVLKKSNEAVAIDYIIPLRTIFPQTGSSSADPYATINLSDWKSQIEEELKRWRRDSNYIPILSLPIGYQAIGGEGRALLLSQEIRAVSEQIVTGMGTPPELVFGGMSFSGSNVSLRMLENMFLRYMTDHHLMLKWAIRNIANYMDWATVSAKFKPFKMADDLQRKAYHFQLNQAGKISDETLLMDADFDPVAEDKLMENETDRRAESQKKMRLAQASIEGEAQQIMARYQMRAQMEQMEMQQQAQQQGPVQGTPGAEAEGVMPGQAAGQPQPAQLQPSQPVQPAPQPPEAMAGTQSPLAGAQPMVQPQAQGSSQSIDLLAMAQQTAQYLMQLDEQSQSMALVNIRNQTPELYKIVLEIMQMRGTQQGVGGATALPEQRPPRREEGTAQL